MKPHYTFIASKNYKGGTTSGCGVKQIERDPNTRTARTDPWSIDTHDYSVATLMDLGSVGTGYCDRPVARVIKIKHAGLNPAGQERNKYD